MAGSKVAADQGAELLVGYVNTVLDQTIGRGIPVPVKAAAVKVAQEVRDKGLDDDREVAIAVSAVVVLRVVNPVLNDLRNRPDITQAQNWTLALVQKAMQNLANGVDGSKEPFMVPVTKALKDREADMIRWMLQIAEGGD